MGSLPFPLLLPSLPTHSSLRRHKFFVFPPPHTLPLSLFPPFTTYNRQTSLRLRPSSLLQPSTHLQTCRTVTDSILFYSALQRRSVLDTQTSRHHKQPRDTATSVNTTTPPPRSNQPTQQESIPKRLFSCDSCDSSETSTCSPAPTTRADAAVESTSKAPNAPTAW